MSTLNAMLFKFEPRSPLPSWLHADLPACLSDVPCLAHQVVRALDTILLVHADHELNCSTAAVRHLTSSGVDVFTAISGGTGACVVPLLPTLSVPLFCVPVSNLDACRRGSSTWNLC